MLDILFHLKAFIALLAIVDPMGIIPIFLSLTEAQTPSERTKTIRTATISVAIILTLACLIGEAILKFFSISLASFRVGSGIILLLMAVSLMQAQTSPAKQTKEEMKEAMTKENISVVPIGTPLLAGPGAISTLIVYSNKAPVFYDKLILILSGIIVALIVWITLRLAEYIRKFLSQTGLNIFRRIMGLILAAISVEFIAGGLLKLFPGLG